MGLFDFIKRSAQSAAADAGTPAARSLCSRRPSRMPPAGPRSRCRLRSHRRRRSPKTLNLDAAQFAPISSADARGSSQSIDDGAANPWWGRLDTIPPASDERTLLIDRSLVAYGLLKPEDLVEIHKIGDQMLEISGDQAIAAEQARAAVEASRGRSQATERTEKGGIRRTETQARRGRRRSQGHRHHFPGPRRLAWPGRPSRQCREAASGQAARARLARRRRAGAGNLDLSIALAGVSLAMQRSGFITFASRCRRNRAASGSFRLRTATWQRPSAGFSKTFSSGCRRIRRRMASFKGRSIRIQCTAARRAAYSCECRSEGLFSNDYVSSRSRCS